MDVDCCRVNCIQNENMMVKIALEEGEKTTVKNQNEIAKLQCDNDMVNLMVHTGHY